MHKRPGIVFYTLLADLLALVAFILAQVLVRPPVGWHNQPWGPILVIFAGLLFLGSGGFALYSLTYTPLQGRWGKWAGRDMSFFVALLFFSIPLVSALHLLGIEISEEIGQWLEVFILGLAASIGVLAGLSRSPEHRGWLMLPVVLGAFIGSFILGEFLVPH